ncbi:type IV pilin protein [Neisseria sp. Ec49-e6-T10]|uniref:type IV pilin protein n=1 Tax=Neisseria sp. Ec49-e6-T10 TaxID=3140744 RepID=UPI003EC0F7C7
MKISKGFTLIEMIVTVAIIGILAAIAMPIYQNYVENTRITAAKANLTKYGQFMVRWKLDKGTFANGSVWPTLPANVTDEFYTYTFKPSQPDSANTELFEILATPTARNTSTKVVFIDQDGGTKVCTSSAATSCE